MRRILPVVFIVVFAVQAFGQRTATVTAMNFNVAGSTYSFDVWGRSTGATSIGVGTSSFYLDFNNAALANPQLTYVNPGYSGTNYLPMAVQVISGKIAVTIEIDPNGSGVATTLSTAADPGERLFQVSLTITNPSATAGLGWDAVNSGITNASPATSVATTWVGSHNGVLPVQLASFTGRVVNQQGHIRLDWRTASETNNFGFYVQKSQNNQTSYQTVSALIPGNGTTLDPHDYTWTDVNVPAGTWYYRLKQVDLDQTEHFSEGILPSGVTGVHEKPLPTEFSINQNYPNPFNPTTKIEYAVPKQSQVRIEVYNLLGQRVTTLVNDVKSAGYHTVEFNATGISSGLYFYRMTTAGTQTFLKKMILTK